MITKENLIKKIYEIAEQVSLELQLLDKSSEFKWEQFSNDLKYMPINYSLRYVRYQTLYYQEKYNFCLDISMFLNLNGSLIGIWPLTFIINKKQNFIKSQNEFILSPIFINLNSNQRNKIILKCLEFLKILKKYFKIENLIFTDNHVNLGYLTDWAKILLSNNSATKNKYILGVDLKKSNSELKNNIRKSYKSLINVASKNWNVKKLEKRNDQIWNLYKELHKDVSGKKTRSDKTWDCQLEMIINKSAILYYVNDNSNKMVAGAFFEFTKDETYYSTGAYKKEGTYKSLSHLLLYNAILDLKKKNIKWLLLGEKTFYPNIKDKNEKELNIEKFKSGFQTNIFRNLIYYNDLK
mgnify:FL=1|jgi:FemAB family protein